MTTSETLLTVVAIRLATLAAAGLIAKIATADHPQQATTCAPGSAVVRVQATPTANEMLRDMRMHD